MKNKRVGFTTSFPVEVLFAAGHTPIDLNNLFVGGNSAAHARNAELKGFPRTVCAWIKGNFDTALHANLDEVVAIVVGDCANSASLSSMLTLEGLPTLPFAYPPQRSRDALDASIRQLEERYEVTRHQTQKTKERLDEIRRKLITLDEWTWKERLVTGAENHLWLVSSSDFNGDPDRFEEELDRFMESAAQRDPLPSGLRCAYLGVPPIHRDLYPRIADLGADVVFNEVQRQFSMPDLLPDIVDQYLAFTYPYSVFERLEDILPQLEKRAVDLVISYTQAFCHLQIDNIILKKKIALPFLTLEGDWPEPLDNRTLLRLESFFEVHG